MVPVASSNDTAMASSPHPKKSFNWARAAERNGGGWNGDSLVYIPFYSWYCNISWLDPPLCAFSIAKHYAFLQGNWHFLPPCNLRGDTLCFVSPMSYKRYLLSEATHRQNPDSPAPHSKTVNVLSTGTPCN